MKFVCDQCGKKYATAENPAPGKVYKLKCKACGHLIVVKGQAGTTTGLPAVTTAENELAARPAAPPAPAAPRPSELTPLPALTPPPMPAPPQAAQLTPLEPEIELQVEPPLPAAVAAPLIDPWAAAAPSPQQVADDAVVPLPASPLPPEVANAVDFAASSPATAEVPAAMAPADPALEPPPADKDELADFAAAAAAVIAAPDGTGPIDDPFLAASRASLPDGYAGPGISGSNRNVTEGESPEPPKAAPPLPRAPVVKGQSSGAPMAIIGLGMAALIGITAWALFGSSKKEAPAPPAVPVATATPPAPSQAPVPAPPESKVEPKPDAPAAARPEPEAVPAVAQKAPDAKADAKPKPAERKPERRPEAKPEPKAVARAEPARPAPVVAPPAPKPAPPPTPAPPPAAEPASESREPELPEAAAALTPDVVNKVVSANRKAFSSCIASAAASEVKLDGRKVALRITVNNNGTVTYPTLDDQSLNGTEMGQCLKSAARLMIFPKFRGDPFHYEVPLVLSGT